MRRPVGTGVPDGPPVAIRTPKSDFFTKTSIDITLNFTIVDGILSVNTTERMISMLRPEEKYAFRKDYCQPHKRIYGAKNRTPNADELVLTDGITISIVDDTLSATVETNAYTEAFGFCADDETDTATVSMSGNVSFAQRRTLLFTCSIYGLPITNMAVFHPFYGQTNIP